MSYVIATAELLAAAAADVMGIGSSLDAANSAAAVPITRVFAAAGDEVSAAIAALFSSHGQAYQSVSAQVAAFQTQFVRALTNAGASYASAEAANVSPLQALEEGLLGVINAPTNLLLSRPLIGNGTNGTPGPGKTAGLAGSYGATVAMADRA
ncbi:hypothetical protein NIIDMKKI_06770 [Mycobacterium kansasii]|uniref:PE family protein n=1 Tax=Mycobacterium kansasii TaxID=1768 RepID=A0A1V3WTB6_MYCKA|nr:PE family protein [Mycobacterium kansasii]BCI85471.1 hypothetical protein NIIDMKKI_06770 [Mycobacterium kansasii]